MATHSATTETRAYSWARTAPSLRSVLTVCACVGAGCGGAEPRTRAHPMDQTVSEEGGRAAGIASRALTAADSIFPSACPRNLMRGGCSGDFRPARACEDEGRRLSRESRRLTQRDCRRRSRTSRSAARSFIPPARAQLTSSSCTTACTFSAKTHELWLRAQRPSCALLGCKRSGAWSGGRGWEFRGAGMGL